MSGEWGELESEGDVYAAKVIGQKPTVLGVKKKTPREATAIRLSPRGILSRFEPPVILPTNSCMALSNTLVQWAVLLNRGQVHACPLDACASQKHKSKQSLAVIEGRTLGLTLARDNHFFITSASFFPCCLLLRNIITPNLAGNANTSGHVNLDLPSLYKYELRS